MGLAALRATFPFCLPQGPLQQNEALGLRPSGFSFPGPAGANRS